MCFLGICCNCGNKSVSKVDISNKINEAITNSNKVINDIVNETINSVSTELVNDVSSDITVDVGSYNEEDLGDINVNGGKFTSTQMAQVDSKSIAMEQIASNQQSITELTNRLITNLQNNVSSDTNLKTAMDTLNQIKQMTENDGGPEKMVDTVFNALQKTIAGGGDSDTQEKNFKNEIGIKVENDNDVENRMKNIISTAINGKISSQTFGNVKIGSAASNKIVARSVNVSIKDGVSGSVDINQEATLDNFTQAIETLNLGSGISNKIIDTDTTKLINDALNKVISDAKLHGINKEDIIDIEKSGIMDFLNNLNPLNLFKNLGLYGTIIIVVIIIAVIGFVFLVFVLPKISHKGVALPPPYTPVSAPLKQ